MDLGRFHKVIETVDAETKRVDLDNRLQSLVNDLNSVAANPGNADVAKGFKDHLAELRDLLESSNLNEPDEDTKQVIFDLDLSELIGNALFDRVLKSVESGQLSANLAANSLQELKASTAKKLALIRSINSAFGELGVDYFELEAGAAEMMIDLPIDAETRTLEDLAKEAKEWHRICDAISETFDAERTPVTVRTLASGSWLLYLAGTASFIFGVSQCTKGIHSILRDLLQMKTLYKQLVIKDTPKDILKKLDAHNSTKVKTDLDKLASKLVTEFYKGPDKGM